MTHVSATRLAIALVLLGAGCKKTSAPLPEAGSSNDDAAPASSLLADGFTWFELDERETFLQVVEGRTARVTRGQSKDEKVIITGLSSQTSTSQEVARIDFTIENKDVRPRALAVAQIQLLRADGCQPGASPRYQIDGRKVVSPSHVLVHDNAAPADAGTVVIPPSKEHRLSISLNERVSLGGHCEATAFRVRFLVEPSDKGQVSEQVSATAETHYVRREPLRRSD